MPKDFKFKISPSRFAQFVDYPHNWYRSEVLKEQLFSHNTSSVLGTIVHYCAEMVAKSKPVDIKCIEEYIDSLEVTDDYKPEVVREHYKVMAETLVNDYVQGNEFLAVEEFKYAHVKKDYYIGGIVDFLQGVKEDCLVGDYKSYHSKTKPRAIPANYRYQLLVLCSLWKANGYSPTRIRLVYINRPIVGEISEKTGKQLKSYPSEVTVLTESLTPEDFTFIDSLLDLCVDSVEASVKHPELTHVIFHDPRLKIDK